MRTAASSARVEGGKAIFAAPETGAAEPVRGKSAQPSPRLSDSLAGRMEILRLHPLAQCEIAGLNPKFLDQLLLGSFKAKKVPRLGPERADRIADGGLPAAIARSTPRRRQIWYRDSIETLISGDVREMVKIASIDIVPRRMALAASQTARLAHLSELADPFQQSRTTIRD